MKKPRADVIVSAHVVVDTTSLGGSDLQKSAAEDDSLESDSKVYLATCSAITAANLITLRPQQARPPGTSFLGSSASIVPCRFGSILALPSKLILDSGSDITLISSSVLNSIDPKPKVKMGQKINLVQVTGKASISGFVQLILYFESPQGPIAMPIEAYVVKGMNAEFILGNDFADQYCLSILRSDSGSELQFGNTGRTIPLVNSISSEGTRGLTRAMAVPHHKRPESAKTSSQTKEPIPVRADRDIVVPPHTVKFVPVSTRFPVGMSEGFIRSIELLQTSPEGSLHLIEAMVPTEKCSVLVANSSRKPLKIAAGEIVGELRDPRKWLDALQDDPLSQELIRSANSVTSLLTDIVRGPPKDDSWEHEHLPEVQGGPKTAETPDLNVIPSTRLLEEIEFNPQLGKEERSALEKVVTKHQKAFGLDGRLGDYPAQVEIRLKPGEKPVSMRPYDASPMKREIIDKQLNTWLETGVIEESNSPWGFPVIIVFRNGKPRFCVDYRKLNEKTVADEYPLPKQSDILQALSGSQWLSTLDALAGFTQMEIKENDRPLTAFRTHRGLHQFRKMPFGLRDGPSIFQRIMNEILSEFLWMFVLVYIDDIVVFSKTFEEHLKHLDWVLGAIAKAGITLAPSKCHLGYQSLLLLGQKVSRLGISTHKEKVDAIVALKPPETVHELQTFLGMMNYFSAYIPFYAWIVSPLFLLLKKGEKWHWNEDCQEAFEISKQVLQSSPVLAYAQPGKGYRLYSDACDYGVAAILQQVQAIKVKDLRGTKLYERLRKAYDSKIPVPSLVVAVSSKYEAPLPIREWVDQFDETIVDIERVIAYWSRVLKASEKNYSPTEKEALALKEGLTKFQPYLEGERIIAITDHAALTWSRTFQNVNRRLLVWGLVFAAYPDLDVVHRAGRVHSNVDPISRLRRRIPFFESPLTDSIEHVELGLSSKLTHEKDWQERLFARHSVRSDVAQTRNRAKPSRLAAGDDAEANAEPSNVQKKISVDRELSLNASNLLPPNAIAILPDPAWIDGFIQGYTEDPFFGKVLDVLRSTVDWSNSKYRHYALSDEGLLHFVNWAGRMRVCVPNNQRKLVLASVHDSLSESAHAGWQRTYNRLAETYYWPLMSKSTKAFVKTCDVCQKIKPRRHAPYGLLQPIAIPEKPFDVVSMDFITDLPMSGEFSAILVIVDKLTKFGIFVPCNKRVDEIETARLFVRYVIAPFGVPRAIISDRDSRWRGDFWKEVSASLGAKRNLTTAYHPQADGQTEIMNQLLEIALRAYVDADRSDWSDKLLEFAMSYNSSVHTATGFSPAYLLYGFEPNRIPRFLVPPGQPQDRSGLRKDTAISFLEDLEAARNLARDALSAAQNAYQNAYNRRRLPKEFDVGDLVLINPHSLRLQGPWGGHGHKLAERYEGPFEVTEKIGPVTYRIRLPPDYDIHPVLNIAHLEPYHESPEEFKPRTTRPIKKRAPTSSKEDWEVEEIVEETLSARKVNGRRRLLYRCKWRYPDGSIRATEEWIPEKDLNNAPDVLREWKAKVKLNPRLKARVQNVLAP
jgi:hypothetical protein